MAAPQQQHRALLDRQTKLHAHFESTKTQADIPAAQARQALLTPAQLVAQQNYNVARLNAGFLSPHCYLAGTLPQPNNPMATLVNGFGLECGKHLIREDGTAAEPVSSLECSCGTWCFLAWGCDHLFCSHDHTCGRLRAVPSGKTRCCRNKKGVHHTAEARVLGPCLDKGCAWWAEREAEIQAAGTFASLRANGELQQVWASLGAWIVFGHVTPRLF
jgi:hypothetical protein